MGGDYSDFSEQLKGVVQLHSKLLGSKLFKKRSPFLENGSPLLNTRVTYITDSPMLGRNV